MKNKGKKKLREKGQGRMDGGGSDTERSKRERTTYLLAVLLHDHLQCCLVLLQEHPQLRVVSLQLLNVAELYVGQAGTTLFVTV